MLNEPGPNPKRGQSLLIGLHDGVVCAPLNWWTLNKQAVTLLGAAPLMVIAALLALVCGTWKWACGQALLVYAGARGLLRLREEINQK